MRRLALASLLALSATASLAACGGGSSPTGTTGSSTSSGTGGSGGQIDPVSVYDPPPESCAYECPNDTCKEQNAPYACPSLGDWKSVPHAESCGDWDTTYPAVNKGSCVATAPSGEALRRSGADKDHVGVFVLPDGRRVRPAGHEKILDDVIGGLTSQVIDVPGTPFVLTVETGFDEHAVRSVDTQKLAQGEEPVAGIVKFVAPETLNSGVAFVPPGRVYVSSHDALIHALTLDPATGALTRDDASSLAVPPGDKGPRYVSGVAVSPDGTKLVASMADDKAVLVYAIAAGPDYGKLLGQVSVGATESFAVAIDPHDLTGSRAYVSMWADKQVKVIDLSDPTMPAVTASYPTGKNPEGMAFLDARFMVVAAANADSLTLVDRVTSETSTIPIEPDPKALRGQEPCALAFDAEKSRLYVALGGENAVVAFDVDLGKTPPVLTRTGRLGASFWPSGVVARAGGDVVVTTLRGHGGGPIPMPFGFGDDDIGERMKGSVAVIPAPSAADLAAGDAQIDEDNDVGGVAGAPTVACPDGAHDFPVPSTNQEKSPVIDHIFFILRENKNFDSLFGDMVGADGEPTYTLKASSEDMDAIWHNLRVAARSFAFSDNYYTDAVFSTQGHVLATYARSSDFNERTWAISGSRADSPRAIPGGGVIPVGRPEEGSLFDWLFHNDVPFNILGEIDGAPDLPPGTQPVLDFHYPGVGQSITGNDLPKACYAAGRVRIGCDLGNFVYQTLPNDHTVGVSSDNPTPETMCAVNDEATGMMLDAISHSPLWKSSLIIITEDDPSSGGEHVDGHRTPLVMVSPWVKRGYVSKSHIDMASIHKIYAHILGLPYPNRQVAGAMIPYDIFTSTPDYTPFERTPRSWPLGCGAEPKNKAPHGAEGSAAKAPVSPAEEELTKLWDFSEEDRQPGLAAQVVRAMRGRPLESLTPAMRARALRWKQGARSPDRDDD
ncbi:MAG: bifunctional YncE family protein/alkaline phosphatase family protein [Byssovorax sp.]